MNQITLEDLDQLDLTGAVMSEKYDGIQARWDGKKLTTRNGEPLNPPQWWIAMHKLAKPCTGELWRGYGTGSGSVNAMLAANAPWEDCTILIFEGAGAMEKVRVVAANHVRGFFDHVVSNGGEGIVLETQFGVCKIKPILDAEASVEGYECRNNEGQISALICKGVTTPFIGVEFRLSSGLSTSDRDPATMPVGLIRFRYADVTKNGLPAQAVYLGKRDARTMEVAR